MTMPKEVISFRSSAKDDRFVCLLMRIVCATASSIIISPRESSAQSPQLQLDDSIILRNHTSVVRAVVFSPDGKLLASGEGLGMINIWSTANWKLLKSITHKGGLVDLAWSPDGKSLYSAAWRTKTIIQWKTNGKQQGSTKKMPARINAIACQPRGRLLAVAGEDGVLRLWDTGNKKEKRQIVASKGRLNAVVFSSDGTIVAVAGDKGITSLWQSATGKKVIDLHVKGMKRKVFALSMSQIKNGEDWCAVGGGYDDLEVPGLAIWDYKKRRYYPINFTNRVHTAPVFAVALSKNSKLMAAAGGDTKRDYGELFVWRINKEKVFQSHKLRGHTRPIHSLSFSPDGERLASGSMDRTVRIWKANAFK